MMSTDVSRTKNLIAFGAIGALALTACGGSDEPFGASATDAPVVAEEPTPTEPGITQPAVTDPASTDPASEPVVAEPAPTDPAVTEPAPVDTEPAASEQAEAWLAPSGDYTLQFPGEPTRTDLPIPDLGADVVADAYILEESSGAYFSSIFDYPVGSTDPDPQVVLEGARDGAVTNVGGSLVESEDVELDGVPGIAFTFEFAGGVGRALVFFDEPRLYQSFGLGVPERLADFEAFVNTFEFTGTQS